MGCRKESDLVSTKKRQRTAIATLLADSNPLTKKILPVFTFLQKNSRQIRPKSDVAESLPGFALFLIPIKLLRVIATIGTFLALPNEQNSTQTVKALRP